MSVTAVREVPMPGRIRALPRDDKGRPIPWFVADLPAGGRDFRVAGGDRKVQALREGLCWVCGQKLPKTFVFLIGPMCAMNRITGEPPTHDQCADYSARVCPFILRPQMVRRTSGLPEDISPPPGIHSDANPGGMVLWTTGEYRLFRPPFGMPGGVLLKLGAPTRVLWWTQGRAATRTEARVLLDDGYARLRQEAEQDIDPPSALAQLRRQYLDAAKLLPPDTQ